MIAESRVKDLMKLLGEAGLALLGLAITGFLLVAVTFTGGGD